ncbi:unnamed protein product [Closterium sp. Naga37s-1]|nr:unnamed protein product [Closterium sp. Naga37s-1]
MAAVTSQVAFPAAYTAAPAARAAACSARVSLRTPSFSAQALPAVRAFPARAERVVAPRAAVAEAGSEAAAEEPKKVKVLSVKEGKQRLLLKFVWLEKNIGIAVDQMIPGQGTVPVSSYMFWPRKDAWEELRELLESKPWLSRKRVIILLNQATDIINLWQQTTFKP